MRHRSATVLAARPDVVNHNIETVARLQRAVRPSAGVRALAGGAGPCPRGGADGEVGTGARAWARPRTRSPATLADLAAVGTSIVTIGQYLRPTSHHLPVARWWTPEDFERFKADR